MPKQRVLIYGCGSIGLRHAHIAHALGAEVTCISSQKHITFPTVQNVERLSTLPPFELAIIATPTAMHAQHLEELVALPIKNILVEKPLFSATNHIEKLQSLNTENISVAYNLRFHPAIQKIRSILQGKKLLAMQMHVGQYLPSWRPDQDYTQSYSAQKHLGGGVLRDLSHELDLATFFAGAWKRVTALGGKVSSLQIQSEDSVTILAEHENCPQVSLHLDYLQNPARRDIVFVLENESLCFNFITNTLTHNTFTENYTVERNTTYQAQMIALLEQNLCDACSFEQGLAIVAYIDAIEKAIESTTWIWNNQ